MICEFGCGKTLPRGSMERHRAECGLAPAKCFACQKSIPRANCGAHAQSCPTATFVCPFGCGQKVRWSGLQEHAGSSCKGAEFDCKYGIAGCRFRGNREKLAQHYKEGMEQHLDLMFAALRDGFDRRLREIEGYLREKETTEQATQTNLAQEMSALEARLRKVEESLPRVTAEVVEPRIAAAKAEIAQQMAQKTADIRTQLLDKADDKARGITGRLCKLEVAADAFRAKLGHGAAAHQKSRPTAKPEEDGQLRREESKEDDKCIIQ